MGAVNIRYKTDITFMRNLKLTIFMTFAVCFYEIFDSKSGKGFL